MGILISMAHNEGDEQIAYCVACHKLYNEIMVKDQWGYKYIPMDIEVDCVEYGCDGFVTTGNISPEIDSLDLGWGYSSCYAVLKRLGIQKEDFEDCDTYGGDINGFVARPEMFLDRLAMVPEINNMIKKCHEGQQERMEIMDLRLVALHYLCCKALEMGRLIMAG